MSFVANLKQARANQSLSKAQEATKCTQFKTVPSRQLGNVSQAAADFNSPPLEEHDPMFPRIRLVSRYISREETENSLPPNCETLMITDLLKQVHPPDFHRPVDATSNFVVLGIVALRSETKTSHRGQKYSMLLLSDLKYDISLALHGKAFEKYWKVQPGTLIAILNPRFWIQKSVGDSRTLALSIVDNKGLLEIGQAKDLGQCEEMTSQSKNTKRCKNWVDVRKSHVCEFHVEQRTARSKRPELNSASAKLWDPKQGVSGKRMSVIKGGDVGWKRGLQVDHQAGLPKSFPGAPVGNVFQSGSIRSSEFFDLPLDTRVRKRQREKRQLEEITDDARLRKRLLTNSTQPISEKGDQQSPHRKQLPSGRALSNEKQPKQSKQPMPSMQPKLPISQTTLRQAANKQPSWENESDSDLEIVP